MKKTELKKSVLNQLTTENLSPNVGNFLKNKKVSQDQEKTQVTRTSEYSVIAKVAAIEGSKIAAIEGSKIAAIEGSAAEIDANTPENSVTEEKNISEQMDEIIKINDKFTLVESILYLLCKELEIPDRSQPGAIGAAIKALYESHYKSMENWKNITKSVQKDDIRQ